MSSDLPSAILADISDLARRPPRPPSGVGPAAGVSTEFAGRWQAAGPTTEPLPGEAVALAIDSANCRIPTVEAAEHGEATRRMPEGIAEPGTGLSPGSLLNGRYLLIKELGRGGMAVVYRALDVRSVDAEDGPYYVAIKVLNEQFKQHPLAMQTLQCEARKAQKLTHPNIVAVHDFDRDGGNVYMVMELMSGHSFDQLLDEGRGLPVRRVTPILQALGAALSYAHRRGIVHSDFKPSNAFMTADGVVKVLDFGIARAAPRGDGIADELVFEMTNPGTFPRYGTLPYASLEMLSGEEPDPRDDVYGLACVTYELLTGHHPFNGIDAATARAMRLRPAPIRRLSGAQWQALQQGLALERRARAPNVEALVAPFSRQSVVRMRWRVVAGSAIAVSIAAALIVPRQWYDNSGGKLAGLAQEILEPSRAPGDRAPQDANARISIGAAVRQSGPPSQTVPREPIAPEPNPLPNRSPEPDRSAAPTASATPDVGALKSQLAAQVAVGDMAAAIVTAHSLRQVLGDSEYAARKFSQLVIDGYRQLARAQLAAGNVDAALQTLAAARRMFGSSQDLKNLERRYVAVGDLYDRLSTAVSLNVAEQRADLEALQASEGAEYLVAEHMLAQTLANRIADERAANRATVAASLLEAGRSIFPDFALQLEQGTAGVLADPGIPVSQR